MFVGIPASSTHVSLPSIGTNRPSRQLNVTANGIRASDPQLLSLMLRSDIMLGHEQYFSNTSMLNILKAGSNHILQGVHISLFLIYWSFFVCHKNIHSFFFLAVEIQISFISQLQSVSAFWYPLWQKWQNVVSLAKLGLFIVMAYILFWKSMDPVNKNVYSKWMPFSCYECPATWFPRWQNGKKSFDQ